MGDPKRFLDGEKFGQAIQGRAYKFDLADTLGVSHDLTWEELLENVADLRDHRARILQWVESVLKET